MASNDVEIPSEDSEDYVRSLCPVVDQYSQICEDSQATIKLSNDLVLNAGGCMNVGR